MSADKLNSSLYQIYSDVKSKTTDSLFNCIDSIGDTRQCHNVSICYYMNIYIIL